MLFVGFVALDFAASGYPKSFRRGSIGFDFRHYLLLYDVLCCAAECSFGGEEHGHAPPLQSWIDIQFRNVAHLLHHVH